MNDPQLPPPWPPAPSTAPTEAAATAPPQPARPVEAWVLAVALGIAVLSAAATAMLWQRLGQTEQELARRGADTLAQAASARAQAEQAQAQVQDMQARLSVAELRLSEVSLQRSQLEELMLSVSRSRDDSLVQDLESALRLAIQQGDLTGSAQPLISALQGAQQRIERAAQPRLNPVQRAIERDIERLRTAAALDTPALAQRLDELVRQMDVLPLKNAMAPVSAQRPRAQISQPASPVDALPPVAAEANSATGVVAQTWERFNAWRAETLARWWAQWRMDTADLVRVSRIDQPEAALLAPEQAYLLRHNIKLLLLNARMSLLARQFDAARVDVASAQRLVERYFDPSAASTRLALQTLTQMQTDLRQETLPRPDETLAALAVAASGR